MSKISLDNVECGLIKDTIHPRYADIVFNHPLKNSFTYSIPERFNQIKSIGYRVTAPFGRRTLMGYIVRIHKNKPKFNTLEIIDILDDKAIFDQFVIDLAEWMSEYYLCSVGEALSTCLPKEIKEKSYELNEVLPEPLHLLNSEQQEAVNTIRQSIKDNQFSTYLLFGVTGSGKTEVYKYLSQYAISKGRQALILVPEISLTPQTINRFQSAFGRKIAILHSKLSQRERYFNWNRIHKGEVDIILGARSAIFCPHCKLGIIIIDEEHESTYKSGDTPRYSAKQLAYKICQTHNLPLILGSATPSIESYYQGIINNINTISLSERHSTHQNPDISLVDMRKEESRSFISKLLFEKITQRLSNKEQIMIFLNKRGYSPLLICKDCGSTLKCPYCDISLTYHQVKNNLLCHYCGYSTKLINTCSSCKGNDIMLFGYGTEKIEDELSELFLSARIGRMDLDTTRRKGAHEKILNSFSKGEIDILIGTQMIAKGLHFPNVTLVGVVLADLSLHLPDFRSSERTFSLLTQISGRAGRGKLKGEVIIQTYLPNHYVIQSTKNQDYHEFYTREIEERKKFLYPPFTRLIKILIRGKKEEIVINTANEIFQYMNQFKTKDIELLGPAPAPLGKINKNYRWQILLKGQRLKPLQELIRHTQDKFSKKNNTYLEIDVDPIALM